MTRCRLSMRLSLVVFVLWGTCYYWPTVTTQGICLSKTGPTDPQSSKQRLFTKHEFHYLNVRRVGTLTAHDEFECTLECLKNPLCLSLNTAASRRPDEKFWCELLSSDKHSNAKDYAENMSSHHFSNMPPCFSSPCQNGGTCVPNYKDGTFECRCRNGLVGKYCEKSAESCKEVYDVHKSNASLLVTLCLGQTPISVLCHMGDFGCGDGRWTPVMKIDGNKDTFHYNSRFWSNLEEYNLPGGMTGFDAQETKLPTYWNTSFSKICLGMKIGQQIKFVVITKQTNSLYSLLADGQFRSTSLGRNTWKTLIGSQASFQPNCNNEGFNAFCTVKSIRIGILGNNENDCNTCDSRIGFGADNSLGDSNTCGNVALHGGDNGDQNIRAMGYILVQ
ncbi:uncharacterized protein LOC110055271 [Orbicella faveolata]|uniref:uncharacterized protein LOC110055271 n=1 Tax=Orbicella faveolata TaxID=48498 RepID=UPI0009E18D00|nr:uncharacterized protein LOC110055271 [Orbicella faveolata]